MDVFRSFDDRLVFQMRVRDIPLFFFGGIIIMVLVFVMTILHPIDTARALKAAVWE